MHSFIFKLITLLFQINLLKLFYTIVLSYFGSVYTEVDLSYVRFLIELIPARTVLYETMTSKKTSSVSSVAL